MSIFGMLASIGGAAMSSSAQAKKTKAEAHARDLAMQAQKKATEKEEEQRREALRRKEEALKIKFPTFLETEAGGQFQKTLQERIAGRGLIDVDAQTSPIAAQRRAGLRRTEAAIGSAASARGLGRSTVPVSQIGEASQAAERDINERMAALEIKRQDQIESAVTASGKVAQIESTGQQARAAFQRGGEFSVADTIARDASIFKANEFAIADSIVQFGIADAANRLKQAEIWASALIGFAKSDEEMTRDILGVITGAQTGGKGNMRGELVAR